MSTNKFKVGDKIVCRRSWGSLKEGGLYTVAKIWKGRWLPDRKCLFVHHTKLRHFCKD